MKRTLSRREFIKLAASVPLGLLGPRLGLSGLIGSQSSYEKKQNVLVVVFDALSAHNISLYGYPRETMPNLSRLAERAIVYHNHYAGASWTLPGTASLLTGTLPWTHRAFNIAYKKVADGVARNNIFRAFDGFYRIAYSHNPLATVLFSQFSESLDEIIPRTKLFLTSDNTVDTFFGKDEDIATVAWIRNMKRKEEGYAYSLFLSHLYEWYQAGKIEEIKQYFPRGLPSVNNDNYYTLEQAINATQTSLVQVLQPFLGYFHYYPPHSPYNTHSDFFGRFDKDKWRPVDKPLDPFTEGKSHEYLLKRRQAYDEFILYADREFGRLFDSLDASGLLENTWVVFTSDHGEMFERGIHGHDAPVLFQPIVHIPLIIFEPGRSSRTDIYTPTSAIDILPTLLYLTGQKAADWTEGNVLPPFAPGSANSEQNIYALINRKTLPLAPLTEATAMLVKDPYKLMYFYGYKELGTRGERVRLFNIQEDPEELVDLSLREKNISTRLLAELKAKLEVVNQPYL